MLIIFKEKATRKQIQKTAQDFDGYVKLVVDIEKETLAAGGERHVDGEQALLANESKQQNLWGGGADLETKELDYNSIINLRPNQDNPSRDILSQDIRKKFDEIVRKILL